MFCVFFQGFYRWAAQVPALLQGLCSKHSAHAQSADYRLPFPQSGPPAEVRTTRGRFFFFCVTTSHLKPEHRLCPESNILRLAIFQSKVPVRALLCRRARGCRSRHLPCGERPFICERQYVSRDGVSSERGVPVSWVVILPRVVPQGVKLLSYLYNEAQNNCSNENYPVLLSLLKTSCEPYTRLVTAEKRSRKKTVRLFYSGSRG